MRTKEKFAAALAVLLLLLLFTATLPAPGGVPEAVLRARNGVVRIFIGPDEPSGSGFALSSDSAGALILTSYHVVKDQPKLYCYFDGAGPVQLEIKAVSEEQDLCVLQTRYEVEGLEPLPLADTISVGKTVYALGYPGVVDDFSGQTALKIQEMTVSDGIVSALQSALTVGNRMRAVKIIQTNANMHNGNSGGPLVNEKGQVVGVSTMGIKAGLAFGFNGAVHLDEVRRFLEGNGIEYRKSGPSQPLMLSAAAAAIVAAAVLLAAALRRRNCRGPAGAGRDARRQPPALAAQTPPAAWAAAAAAAPVSGYGVSQLPQHPSAPGAVQGGAQPAASPVPAGVQLRRKSRWGWFAAAVLLVAGVFSWYTRETCLELRDAWEQANYAQVALCYQHAPWIQVWTGPEKKLYSEARVKVENYELQKAIRLFQQLDGYRDSRRQIRMAETYLKVINGFQEDPLSEYLALQEIEGYLDSETRMEALWPQLYQKGVEKLRSGQFSAAAEYFEHLPEGYDGTELYSALLSSYAEVERGGGPKSCYALAVSCENAGIRLPLFLIDTYLSEFVQGMWASPDGWWFEKTEEGYASNLGIQGDYRFERSGMYGADVVKFDFQDADHMRLIYNGRQYDLTRR